MELKELRKKNGLTQKETSLLIGIPYRTYLRYENNNEYKGTYKYKKIFDDLSLRTKIDENTGILSIQKIKDGLLPVLEKHNINYCYLFGSYARGEAKPTSDIDLLVDTKITGLEFLELVEEIRKTLSKRIDLLRLCDLSTDNPIVMEILKEGIRIK